ncbi:MAG: hypothetical protein ABIV63_10320, partial [Caldimonas sp.]
DLTDGEYKGKSLPGLGLFESLAVALDGHLQDAIDRSEPVGGRVPYMGASAFLPRELGFLFSPVRATQGGIRLVVGRLRDVPTDDLV